MALSIGNSTPVVAPWLTAKAAGGLPPADQRRAQTEGNGQENSPVAGQQNSAQNAEPRTGATSKSADEAGRPRSGELSQEDQQTLQKLQARDREVRNHEAAHLAAAAGIALSGANFNYQRGPDGQLYAIGGDVSVDTSTVAGDPQATIAKARQIRRAALAPAQPSTQDLSVAASAGQMEATAQAELAEGKTGNGKLAAYASAAKGPSSKGAIIDASA